MDIDIAYDWLRVWVSANHTSFQNCIIDTSDIVHDGLNHVTEKIIEEAITTTDPDIIGISWVLDAKDEEDSEGMCNIDHEAVHQYWMPRMKRIQKECVTLIMRLFISIGCQG